MPSSVAAEAVLPNVIYRWQGDPERGSDILGLTGAVYSNLGWMVWAVGVSFLLLLMVVYVPFLQPFFDTVPPGAGDWLFMAPFFFASPVGLEFVNIYFRVSTATGNDKASSAVCRELEVELPVAIEPQAGSSLLR